MVSSSASIGRTGALAFKVDVDTRIGLREGAPRLLEIFARHGVRATFFVTMGPDRTGRAALRVFRQKGFLQKMLRSRAPGIYPLETMLRGTLLPAAPVVSEQPGRLEEIAASGHEAGVHGWDHVHWHDHLHALSREEVAKEVGQAVDLFAEIVGSAPMGFAAPGWQCSAASLSVIDSLGFQYRSDTRGTCPFRPTVDGYTAKVPELPTTLPTLDELLGQGISDPEELIDFYDKRIVPGKLHVHTIHTEIEGSSQAAQLDALLERVKDRLPILPLGDIVRALPSIDALPKGSVVRLSLPGRGGEVACQGGQ